LRKYFSEEKSMLYTTTWVAYHQNLLGAGYKNDEKLIDKRYEICSTMVNKEEDFEGSFSSIVLFHTPTHFVIEYLRFDLRLPYEKKFTIIDGRKNMKEWVGELKDEQINKRVYAKYRKDDNIKY
jgi:hypothetical protein